MELGDQFSDATIIGEGTFGKVYKAKYKNSREVAVKKIKLQNPQEGVPSTAMREIALLKSLKNHSNIVELIEVMYSSKQKNLCLVFQYFDYDLRKFLKSRTQTLNQHEIKIILFQILNGVNYCHNNKVVHRDLKPQNILIDNQCNIKLADFGLARLLPLPLKTITPQIQTVWYRAPEVLLGQEKYSFSVDIWAVGCIFAEIITRKPLLMGNGYQIQQIFKIFQYFGTPTLSQWQTLGHLNNFKVTFPKWKKTDNIRKNFTYRIGQLGTDLLQKMLCYDPNKRITAQLALLHPYFKDLASDEVLKCTLQL